MKARHLRFTSNNFLEELEGHSFETCMTSEWNLI